MSVFESSTKHCAAMAFVTGILIGGAGIAALGPVAIAAATAPTEHKGLKVEALGVVPARSMEATLGLEGHKLQLRAITIEAGGQIARHNHETRPGLVKVIEGEWVEGRSSGEVSIAAGKDEAIIEDENTTHWFFNRSGRPATAIVCDIVPDK
jgi:quercetin dioxygenase-like cupin family protein